MGLVLNLVCMLAFPVAYYRLGEIEYRRGFLLGAISLLLWLSSSLWLGWGQFGCILVQIALFAILWVINLFRTPGPT